MMNKNAKWYNTKGDKSDVVFSTRIRLARNVEQFPFPAKLDPQGREQVCKLIGDALLNTPGMDFSYIEMKNLSRTQAVSLAERHLISPEFALSPDGRSMLLSGDESVCIMLCEEDHVRLQVIAPGLNLDEAYAKADKLDNLLSEKVTYAFDERIGYLTQCPTNLGTAMRASVMLHLPALAMSGQIYKISSTVSKLGLVIRGANGEGSSPKGDMYQLSNQITLGISEKTALDNLASITDRLVSQERAMRAELMKNPAFEDKIWRAMGILKSARLLSGDEFMELISLARLGAAQGVIEQNLETIGELMIDMQPATINAREGVDLDAQRRDEIRAAKVRESLA